jgi:hypothetical protein
VAVKMIPSAKLAAVRRRCEQAFLPIILSP